MIETQFYSNYNNYLYFLNFIIFFYLHLSTSLSIRNINNYNTLKISTCIITFLIYIWFPIIFSFLIQYLIQVIFFKLISIFYIHIKTLYFKFFPTPSNPFHTDVELLRITNSVGGTILLFV